MSSNRNNNTIIEYFNKTQIKHNLQEIINTISNIVKETRSMITFEEAIQAINDIINFQEQNLTINKLETSMTLSVIPFKIPSYLFYHNLDQFGEDCESFLIKNDYFYYKKIYLELQNTNFIPKHAFYIETALTDNDNKLQELNVLINKFQGEYTDKTKSEIYITLGTNNYSMQKIISVVSVEGSLLNHVVCSPASHDYWSYDTGNNIPDCDLYSQVQIPITVDINWLKNTLAYNEFLIASDYYEQTSINNYSYGNNLEESNYQNNTKKIKIDEIDPSIATDMNILNKMTGDRLMNVAADGYQEYNAQGSNYEDSQNMIEQSEEVIIPSYAAWFSMKTINEIEKKSLPEFFEDNKQTSKTPSVYKEYRDFMINTYRINPKEYLTVTACRRNLVGDVDPDTRPSTLAPPYTGHFQITADTPRGLQPFQPNITLSNEMPNSDFMNPQSQGDNNYHTRQNIYNGTEKSLFQCLVCNNDCSQIRYHNVKTKIDNICVSCFNNGRFPNTMYSSDFVRLDKTTKDGQADGWTDQEMLLLLEGIEMYQEDWNKVSEHVSTKTKEECILCFLQLPIEDPYLENNTETSVETKEHMPFSQADNPIMSVVAFLASNVNPGVAAAAAKAALKEISENKEINDEEMQKTTATALAAASAKAYSLKMYEDAEITNLIQEAIEIQMEKIDIKIKMFDIFKEAVERERKELVKEKVDIFHKYCQVNTQKDDESK